MLAKSTLLGHAILCTSLLCSLTAHAESESLGEQAAVHGAPQVDPTQGRSLTLAVLMGRRGAVTDWSSAIDHRPSTIDHPPEARSQPASEGDARLLAIASALSGSAHDFSRLTGRPGDACSACHVPHVQAVGTTRPPSGEATLELYRMSGQREVYVPDRYMPGPTSLICLSCHNGTVASSTLGTSHELLAGRREGFDVPDGFVWRDHPIGVPYPANAPDYRPRAFLESEGRIRLPEGRVECISCHDPHHTTGLQDTLTVTSRRSALCLDCHRK